MKIVNTGSRNGNSYVLRAENGETLILDAGCKYKDILRTIDYKVSDVTGVLLTHEHLDHIRSFKEFQHGGIPVYGCDELADFIEVVYGEKIRDRPERATFHCGSFAVTPFYLLHTTRGEGGELVKCPNFGYLITHPEMGKLLYMTDMEYCPYNFAGWNIEHFLVECNYDTELVDREQANYSHRLQGHCSLETCKGIIRANKTLSTRTVTTIHMSDGSADLAKICREIKALVGDGVTVNTARAGMEIKLSRFPWEVQ